VHIHIAHMVLLHTWSKEIAFTLCTQDIIMHTQIAFTDCMIFIAYIYIAHIKDNIIAHIK